MRLLITSLLIVFSILASSSDAQETPNESANKPLPFRISKETTYITGPLMENGLVDYAGYLNQQMSEKVTPETNAAVLYWKAIGNDKEVLDSPKFYQKLVEALGTDPFAEGGPYLVGLGVIAKEAGVEFNFDENTTTGKQYDLAMKRPWTSDEAPLMKQWLVHNEKPLSTVLAATKQPHYYRPLIKVNEEDMLIAVLLPDVQRYREIARCFSARSMLALGEERPEDAIRELLAMHRLARHSAEGATIIEMLVGIAIEGMAIEGDEQLANDSMVSAEQLKSYQQKLSQLPQLVDFERGFLGERMMNLDAVQYLCTQSMTDGEEDHQAFGMLGINTSSLLGKLGMAMFQYGIDWNQVITGINEFHDQYMADLNQGGFAEQREGLRNLSKTLQAEQEAISSPTTIALSVFATPEQRGKNMRTILLALLTPALEQAHEAGTRGETKTQLSQLGIALAAYHKQEKELPETLESLVPNHISKLPNDPYTGKPFVYRVDDDGAIIYSLGQNLKDDGGTSIDDDRENHDHVFRVKRIEN
jgi:hypothetical protein